MSFITIFLYFTIAFNPYMGYNVYVKGKGKAKLKENVLNPFTGYKNKKKRGSKIMCRIYLTNLGKYNEGMLIGKWLDIPADEDELKEAFEEIGVSSKPDEDGNVYDEYFITDYESDFHIDEYDAISSINEKEELYEELIDKLNGDEEAAKAIVKYYGCINKSDFDYVLNIEYRIYEDVNDMSDVAWEYTREVYSTDDLGPLADYIDYEAIGYDMDLEGTYIFYDDNQNKSNCIEVVE